MALWDSLPSFSLFPVLYLFLKSCILYIHGYFEHHRVFSVSLSWLCGTLYHHSPYFLFCIYSCNLVFCTFMVTLNITVCSLVSSHGSVGLSTIILLISCSVFTPVILYFVHSWFTLNITVCSLVPFHGSVGLSTIILLISCFVFTPVILYFLEIHGYFEHHRVLWFPLMALWDSLPSFSLFPVLCLLL